MSNFSHEKWHPGKNEEEWAEEVKLEFLYIQEKKTFSLDAKAAGSQKKSECDSSGPPLSNSQNCSEGGEKKKEPNGIPPAERSKNFVLQNKRIGAPK